MPDNHRVLMDALVERIKRDISQNGVCEVNRVTLPIIWGNNDDLSILEKRDSIRDFAALHNFRYVVDFDLTYAVFR